MKKMKVYHNSYNCYFFWFFADVFEKFRFLPIGKFKWIKPKDFDSNNYSSNRL